MIKILDVAERLVQTRGFNRFSYADIAREVGVTKPALHYHFPSKTDLGVAIIGRYHERFTSALAGLCGMLAAESETLPEAMRSAIVRFFDDNVAWLTNTLLAGKQARVLRFYAPAAQEAATLLSSLEGAMLIARLRHDPDSFDATSERLVATLTTRPR